MLLLKKIQKNIKDIREVFENKPELKDHYIKDTKKLFRLNFACIISMIINILFTVKNTNLSLINMKTDWIFQEPIDLEHKHHYKTFLILDQNIFLL